MRCRASSRRMPSLLCRTWSKDFLILVGAGLVAPLIMVGTPAAASPADVDWTTYLGDKGRSLYSPLQQINSSNVAQLKVAWTYDSGDKGEYQANNLIVAGVLYTASPSRKLIALDAATGRQSRRGAAVSADYPQVAGVDEDDLRAAQRRLLKQQRLNGLRRGHAGEREQESSKEECLQHFNSLSPLNN